VIAFDLDQVRLWLHVVGACVWIGGQIALAGLVPVLRREATPEVVRAVARQFQRIAWPAFALLLVTGIWNLVEANASDRGSKYLATLFVKLVFVALSGLGAAAHSLLTGPAVAQARSDADARRRRALSGATAGLGLLFALGAAFFGIQL
jgi:putative copper export protein